MKTRYCSGCTHTTTTTTNNLTKLLHIRFALTAIHSFDRLFINPFALWSVPMQSCSLISMTSIIQNVTNILLIRFKQYISLFDEIWSENLELEEKILKKSEMELRFLCLCVRREKKNTPIAAAEAATLTVKRTPSAENPYIDRKYTRSGAERSRKQ